MNYISTKNAPAPSGHYSQAVVHNGLVYISGQLPVNPGMDEKYVGTIEAQTLQTLKNLEAILTEAGSNLEKVIKTTVYVADIGLWDRVNTIYSDFFKDHKPARAVVPTKELHFGFQIEIEAIASV